jgi:glutamate racemase
MNGSIGIFDSGIGGLTVLNKLLEVLPEENYIYIGDNKNCPYGDKTKEQLFEYSCCIIDYFLTRDVKLIVIGCNTVNSNIIDNLISKYKDVKLIGIIDSTVRQAIDRDCKNCLIIGTNQTIKAGVYESKIKLIRQDINIMSKATPLLVPMIEKRDANIKQVLHQYLGNYKNRCDTLILGCTHYEIIRKEIIKVINPRNIISSSHGVVSDVKNHLEKNNWTNNDGGNVEILTTGNLEDFIYSSSSFFNYHKASISYINLDENQQSSISCSNSNISLG